MFGQGRRDGEVAGCDDSELVGLCLLFNVHVITCRQPGRSHDHADAFVQRCENVTFHHVRPGVVDKHIGWYGQCLIQGCYNVHIGPRPPQHLPYISASLPARNGADQLKFAGCKYSACHCASGPPVAPAIHTLMVTIHAPFLTVSGKVGSAVF